MRKVLAQQKLDLREPECHICVLSSISSRGLLSEYGRRDRKLIRVQPNLFTFASILQELLRCGHTLRRVEKAISKSLIYR